jgi:hypothetical protein
MNTPKHICDCIGTEAQEAFCAMAEAAENHLRAAADAMDLALKDVAQKEAEFFSYLISKYGPSENID